MKKLKYLILGVCSMFASITCFAGSPYDTNQTIMLRSESEVAAFCTTNNCISVVEGMGGALFYVTYNNGGDGPGGEGDGF